MRLIIHRASVFDLNSTDETESNIAASIEIENFQPGQVVIANKTHLLVKAGDSLISIERIQPAGKKPMPVQDFLRGKPPSVGDWLK